jgi:hypothetical protein
MSICYGAAGLATAVGVWMITARRQPEARGVAQVEEQVKVTKKYVDVLREQNKLDLDHLEQMVRNYARVREVK